MPFFESNSKGGNNGMEIESTAGWIAVGVVIIFALLPLTFAWKRRNHSKGDK